MLGMCALLTPIANHIQRKHPSCVQALYADDRSFTCSTATEIWQVRNEWHVWSNKVGLQENPTKEQYYQRNVQGCRSLEDAGCPQETVSTSITLLRFQFMGVTQRKAKDRELKRLTEAKEVLRKCKCLPGSRTRKAAVARVCAPAKASWDGCFEDPLMLKATLSFREQKRCISGQSSQPCLYSKSFLAIGGT